MSTGLEEHLCSFLWQVEGGSGRDLTECGRMASVGPSPTIGEEVLMRLQRPNVLIKDSLDSKGRLFVANDHNKAAGSYQSPYTGEWFGEDGTQCPVDEMPAGVQRFAELDTTKKLRATFRDAIAAQFRTRLPTAHHSAYLWELAPPAKGYGLAVLTKLIYDAGSPPLDRLELDLIQSMTVYVGNSVLLQLKTLGYNTLRRRREGRLEEDKFKLSAKCVDIVSNPPLSPPPH